MQRPVGILLVCSMLLFCHVASEVLFLISCPSSPQAKQSCFKLQENLRQQQQLLAAETIRDYVVKVHIMDELFNYWTVLDALPHLQGETRLLNAHTEWIIWCQPNTHVSSLHVLLEQLALQNAQELAYYGHALYDSEATIIHHFAHYKNPTWFPYPMLSAGIMFTGRLLRSLAELVSPNALNTTRHSEFAIDAPYELARFIYDNLPPDSTVEQQLEAQKHDADALLQRKIILKSVPYICPSAGMSPTLSTVFPEIPAVDVRTSAPCVLQAKTEPVQTPLPAALPSAQRPVHCLNTTSEHIYFAIKTCAKFHKERIPIIEHTWAPDAMLRRYYSDAADIAIPTISTGIPNVQAGHCAKTLAILQLSLKDMDKQMKQGEAEQSGRPGIRWLMLVDDDTLLSVPRLGSLLSCYNHTDHVYLGERYGYRLHAPDGFNYHTGGAGIVFSIPLVRLIVERCSCPSATSPDDMILGYCLHALGVPALHSPAFHQGRPQDYADTLLQLTPPISFHKFEQTDPQAVYRRWLGGGGRIPAYSNTSQRLASGSKGQHRRDHLPELLHLGMTTGLGAVSKHLDL